MMSGDEFLPPGLLVEPTPMAEKSNALAERDVLGSCLQDPDDCDLAVQLLKPSDFYFPKNQAIFRQIQAARALGEPTDMTNIARLLRDAGTLESVTGSYLSSLIDFMVVDMKHSAGLVIDERIRRDTFTHGNAISKLADRREMSVEELRDAASKLVKDIFHDEYLSTLPPSKISMRVTQDELAAARLAPACIVQNYLYCDVATLAAPGGTGKTSQLLFEIVHIALDRPLYGLDICRPGWTLYITAEDRREILVGRMREIMQDLELSDSEQKTILEDGPAFWDVTGGSRKLVEVRDGNLELTSMADEIVNAYKSDPPVLVVFDPLVSFGAGEGYINDNEQALITAGRRIVRGLGCCVRFVCHTGKMNARNKVLDQYSSRGGSALSDGTRMAAVMQSWKPGDDRRLPPGLKPSEDSSITILARPKLSYSPPDLPLIWIRRTGWHFEHVIDIPIAAEEREKAVFDQVERFVASEVKSGNYHSRKSLEDALMKFDLSRDAIRRAVNQLLASGILIMAELPENRKQGAWKKFLTTPDLADF